MYFNIGDTETIEFYLSPKRIEKHLTNSFDIILTIIYLNIAGKEMIEICLSPKRK